MQKNTVEALRVGCDSHAAVVARTIPSPFFVFWFAGKHPGVFTEVLRQHPLFLSQVAVSSEEGPVNAGVAHMLRHFLELYLPYRGRIVARL
jgi:hypothetical protein